MKAAVFLDRDNTIIENDGDLGDPEKVVLFRGAASAIASLRGLGYCAVVVTNQGGVARGKYSEQDVQAVHRRINEIVEENSNTRIDRFYYCPYHPEGTVEKYTKEHPWRKPQPGMLHAAAEDLELDLSQSWLIGDALRDIEAGQAAGVRTILLSPDAKLRPPLKTAGNAPDPEHIVPDFTARNLIEAARIIAQQRRPDVHDETWEQHEGERTKEEQTPGTRYEKLQPAKEGVVAKPDPIEKRPHRPFRPIDIGPEEEGEEERPATKSAAKPTPPAQSQVAPVTSTPAPAPAPPARKPTQPAENVSPVETVDTTSEPVLRQLLAEVRGIRNDSGEFSYLRVFATVMQMVALVCLIGGFWIGGDDLTDVVKWMATAIVLQLSVVACLLFDR